ncbi:SPI-1 type III secretion system effector SopD [Salmonella bongori]|uniref:SPI-1 type III secretion system effector SopD n=1 Tax=Salmonella bongori TaxID=54736 RepID=UPI00126F388B|nr:SPI-1 type III secretion system effector SopD [Salmonella bongori]ECG8261263.1 type III secretion system effector SopD [Salmonella bongori serovar 48:i:-]ECG9252178.1 SPI-1 type III secretion system effector SopD [Salmonella bongori]EDP8708826.1 SPI-1 type III secretion system effector SopD [Salmonella bongori]EDP8726801.1 SPI-1 type III secretion system effector SopD [Salmonella bongori]EEO9372176.1 SPI-1 type III secretion system effector SopD [Salmonella bongori]
MPVTLHFGNQQNCMLNETRLAQLLSADKEKATHKGYWNKLQDHFRSEKQDHALEVLHGMLYGYARNEPGEMEINVEGMSKIYAFKHLQRLACPADQDLFRIQMDASQTQLLFMIGDTVISQSSIQDTLNLSENAVVKSMDRAERELFLKICEMIGSTITWHADLLQGSASTLRKEVAGNAQIKEAVYKMMRPDEAPDHRLVEWRGSLTEKEESILACINADSFDIITQFCKLGYREVQSEVSFFMIHPCITYLLHSYSPITEFKETNTAFLNNFNQDYDNYHSKKRDIDPILEEIYLTHEHSLHIGKNNCSRNILML